VTDKVELGGDFATEATVTIFYQNYKYTDGELSSHTDTNYDLLFDEFGDNNKNTTDEERAKGITIKITLEEVEDARMLPELERSKK
jgi:hypothetical protein